MPYDQKNDAHYSNAFASVNRRIFIKEKEAYREQYLDLVKRIEAAVWIETLIRTKVLAQDDPSSADRERGRVVSDHARVRSAWADLATPSPCLDSVRDQVTAAMAFDCHYCGWPIHVESVNDLSDRDWGVLPEWELVPWFGVG